MSVRGSNQECDAQWGQESEELVAEFARHVLQTAAPDELVLFDETAAEYFNDPEAVLHPRHREESVGFGLDLQMLTPYVLAVVTPVIGFLMSIVAETAQEVSRPHVVRLVRRLFRKRDMAPEAASQSVPALTSSQAQQIRQITFERGKGLGLDEDRAKLLADCVVGGLVSV